jgi:PDZ domain-containing secreted protein
MTPLHKLILEFLVKNPGEDSKELHARLKILADTAESQSLINAINEADLKDMLGMKAYHIEVILKITARNTFDELDNLILKKERIKGVKLIRSQLNCGLSEAINKYNQRQKDLGL